MSPSEQAISEIIEREIAEVKKRQDDMAANLSGLGILVANFTGEIRGCMNTMQLQIQTQEKLFNEKLKAQDERLSNAWKIGGVAISVIFLLLTFHLGWRR
jgi:hypothetical protein